MKSQHCIRASALLVILTASLPAGSTINSTNKFAYSANAGWINFLGDVTNGIVFGEFFLSGYAYGANFGWIDFGDGTPANGIQYQNNSATDCGVNHDGLGNLSGFAYGANIGWINFDWAHGQSAREPAHRRVQRLCLQREHGLDQSRRRLPLHRLDDHHRHGWRRHRRRVGEDLFRQSHHRHRTSDFDKDGATDKNEYLAGTAPNDSNDYFKIISSTYNGGLHPGHGRLHHRCHAASTGWRRAMRSA